MDRQRLDVDATVDEASEQGDATIAIDQEHNAGREDQLHHKIKRSCKTV